jgi:hypothetical protein
MTNDYPNKYSKIMCVRKFPLKKNKKKNTIHLIYMQKYGETY